ncbi:MAG TPA: hypothetical protein VGH76_27620 [Actinomycetospora sp.]|uniref:hypothetical protein n=1 Tax=Actinomycetospora sp. TaxID=1872135 RepID=UPI002F3E24F2
MIDERAGQREALKRVAVALLEGGVPFALAGGYAAWAYGAPEPEHDVDVVVAEEAAGKAAEVLAAAGLDVAHPPEDWLFKVYTDGAMVDVLHRVCGHPVGPEMLGRALEKEVLSVWMPVSEVTDVLVGKLCALNEQRCDLNTVLPAARAVREQVDWERAAREVAGNDVAVACLYLLRRLGVVPAGPAVEETLTVPGP